MTVKQRNDKQLSIYVPPWVGDPLGGFTGKQCGLAVRCWAKLLEDATIANAQALKPEEWEMLALVCAGKEVQFMPEWRDPGSHMADLVRAAEEYHSNHVKPAANLSAKLDAMDYVHAWAAIWSLRWRALADASGEWWTLNARRAALTGKQG